jgi:hypothetical protein
MLLAQGKIHSCKALSKERFGDELNASWQLAQPERYPRLCEVYCPSFCASIVSYIFATKPSTNRTQCSAA